MSCSLRGKWRTLAPWRTTALRQSHHWENVIRRSILTQCIYSDGGQGETVLSHRPTLQGATGEVQGLRKTAELTGSNSRVLSLEEDLLSSSCMRLACSQPIRPCSWWPPSRPPCTCFPAVFGLRPGSSRWAQQEEGLGSVICIDPVW